MKKKKVVLIGWDAADWLIIKPLLDSGKMPALAKLMAEGVHGNMSTMNPPYSPMLWSSVASGMTPDKHGVLGFLELDTEAQVVRPVTVFQRKVNAIWNILHHQGMKSNVISWWPSHPSEPIDGVIISDQFAKLKVKDGKIPPIPEGSVHPVSMLKNIRDLRVIPNELTAAHILPFVPMAGKIDQEKDKRLETLTKMIAENSTTHACSTWLMENTEWDLTAVYYDLIDHFCHLFMKFRAPQLPSVPDDLFELYKDAVNGAYQYQDMLLERTMQLAGEDALVMVMSDHGFVSDSTRILKMPKVDAAPALEHREFGIFAAKGPGIRKGEKIYGTSLLDIAPTILTYFGLPVGEDMDGMVLKDIFIDPPKIEYIPSWEEKKGDFGRHLKIIETDPLSEQKAMEQLIELGYVERPDEKMEVNLLKTRCSIQYNLARVFMGKGDIVRAEELLRELIEEKVNIAPYLLDLVDLLIKQEKFSEARKYLDQLRRVDITAEKKTNIIEAKILFGMKETKQALKILRGMEKKSALGGTIHYELGKLLLSMSQFKRSLVQFQKAVEMEPEKAKYHHALAVNYLELHQLDEALDHSLTAVELVRYFSDAHFTLGRIFEKMGDTANAKVAYETAEKLNNNAVRPKLALENIEQKEVKSSEKVSQFPEVVIVSGLPRSGTSMMMQMLDATGLPILTDEKRKQDIDNPKGYFEYEKVKGLQKDNTWLHEAEGKTVKVISQLLKFLPRGFRYKIIYMTRDLDEVIESQRVMLRNNGIPAKKGLGKVYQTEMKKLEQWQSREPGVEIIHVPYVDVLEKPEVQAKRIAEFLNKDLDIDKMIHSVDEKLYRNRIYKFKA